jgi:benzylsuccinate CoA-transferase BbsE subunit
MQEALLIAQETAMQSYDLNKDVGKTVRNRVGARSALPIVVPGMGPYEASDGWVWGYMGAPGGAPWPELLSWMEREGKAEDLTEDPYRSVIEQLNLPFLTALVLSADEQKKHGPALAHIDEVLTRFFASKTKWELYEQAQNNRLLIGIASTPEDLAKSPQLNARDWFEEIEHPELGDTLRYPGPPYRLSETPWRVDRKAPLLGEHNAEVLSELGYTKEDKEALFGSGAM